MSHAEEIKKNMLNDFRLGGKLAKLGWVNHWFNYGKGKFPLQILWTGVGAFIGVKGLGDYVITQNLAGLMPVVVFYTVMFPIAIGWGLFLHMKNMPVIEGIINNTLNPFSHAVCKKLKVKVGG